MVDLNYCRRDKEKKMKHDLIIKEPELSFDSIHQELNNFLRDTFMESVFSHPLTMRKNLTWRPAIEMKQTPKEYKIKVQLPGVNKDAINVEVNNDFVTISAEIKEEKTENEEETKTCEFRYGKYMRTISLETPVKADESEAEYNNGVLKIRLKKQQTEKNNMKKLTIK
ncbi:MAG: hypothetical protein DKM22_07170 [Candidatus Melainabacteria bacterium]|nr:MAG: hypothetical protein DKM22_07170 [Candidatus Melainabacteria bacterium]